MHVIGVTEEKKKENGTKKKHLKRTANLFPKLMKENNQET